MLRKRRQISALLRRIATLVVVIVATTTMMRPVTADDECTSSNCNHFVQESLPGWFSLSNKSTNPRRHTKHHPAFVRSYNDRRAVVTPAMYYHPADSSSYHSPSHAPEIYIPFAQDDKQPLVPQGQPYTILKLVQRAVSDSLILLYHISKYLLP